MVGVTSPYIYIYPYIIKRTHTFQKKGPLDLKKYGPLSTGPLPELYLHKHAYKPGHVKNKFYKLQNKGTDQLWVYISEPSS